MAQSSTRVPILWTNLNFDSRGEPQKHPQSYSSTWHPKRYRTHIAQFYWWVLWRSRMGPFGCLCHLNPLAKSAIFQESSALRAEDYPHPGGVENPRHSLLLEKSAVGGGVFRPTFAHRWEIECPWSSFQNRFEFVNIEYGFFWKDLSFFPHRWEPFQGAKKPTQESNL